MKIRKRVEDGHVERTQSNVAGLLSEMTEEELYQAKLLVARSKFWTPEIEKLLRRWRKQVNVRSAEHKEAEKKYSRRYYLLGGPATVLSTVVASGILTTFKNCNICVAECNPAATSACASDEYVRITMGILGVISLALTALALFFNYGEASNENKSAANDYEKLVRKIDSILETPVSARGDPIAALQEIRSIFDDISKNSPSSVSKTSLGYSHLKDVDKGGRQTPLPIGSPGERKRSRMPDVSSLAKILTETVEKEREEEEILKKRIEIENNYDTDTEDGKEVVIAADLEAMRPEDILRDERKEAVQASLTRALQFELGRLYPPRERLRPKTPKRNSESETESESSDEKDVVLNIDTLGQNQEGNEEVQQSSSFTSTGTAGSFDKDKGEIV